MIRGKNFQMWETPEGWKAELVLNMESGENKITGRYSITIGNEDVTFTEKEALKHAIEFLFALAGTADDAANSLLRF